MTASQRTAEVLEIVALCVDGLTRRTVDEHELEAYARSARLIRAARALLDHRDVESATHLVELMAANPRIRLQLAEDGTHAPGSYGCPLVPPPRDDDGGQP